VNDPKNPTAPRPRKGRGASANPDGRYEAWRRESVDDAWSDEPEPEPLRTTLSPDASRRVITRNDSPDVPFTQSINPYRGCEHGCSYCFARPTHAYLGLSPGLDFETRLSFKPEAARQLAEELARPGYRCEPIALGINTDAYQPAERGLELTRRILEVLQAHGHPVSIVTKSALIERDLDILAPMAVQGLAEVFFSVTTLDPGLARRMEPRAASPRRRIAAMERVAAAGVPTGVLFAPVIPALNDVEMESVLERCAEAGADSAGYVLLRLPRELSELFTEWLEQHYPLKARHVMSLIRQMHGGRDYDARFGRRMRGGGPFAELIARRFASVCRRLELDRPRAVLRTDRFRVPAASGDQLDLFASAPDGP
jgi:DNA repair photolyase